MTDEPQDGLTSLSRALQIYLDWKQSGKTDSQQLLGEHPDLAEYLEPLVEPGSEDGEETPADEPRQLGQYRLLGLLGQGGMGDVFEAIDTSLNRRVAIKLLPRIAELQPRTMARFRREAEVVAGLQHPGIVDVLTSGEVEGRPYLAMELIEGVPLDRVVTELQQKGAAQLTGGALSALVSQLSHSGFRRKTDSESASSRSEWREGYLQSVAALGIQVAEALHFAHESGVVHRDVKPSNIVVRPDGTAVLTDFGLARLVHEPGMTLTGEIAGTPYYISPEQSAHTAHVDRRTDVFSLGVTLYELICLRRPFEADTQHELLQAIQRDEPVEPHRLNSSVPMDLSAVLLKALAKLPQHRYGSAEAFADDLRAWIEHRPVTARRTSSVTKAWRWIQREPLKAALATVLFVGSLLLSGGLGFWWSQQDTLAAGRKSLEEERKRDLLEQAYLLEAQQDFAGIEELLRPELEDLDDDPEIVAVFTESLLSQRGSPEKRAEAGRVLDERSALVSEHASLQMLAKFVGLRDASSDVYRISDEMRAAMKTATDFYLAARLTDQALRLGIVDQQEKARDLYLQAVLASDSPRRRYYFALARAIQRSGDRGFGRFVAQRILDHWSRDWLSLYHAAMAVLPVDVDQAIEWMTEAYTSGGSNHSFVAYHLALAHQQKGDLPKAVAVIEKALEADPDDSDLLLRKSALLSGLNRENEAEPVLRLATANSDGALAIYNQRLGNLVRRREFAAALELGAEILEEYPNAARIYDLLGVVHAQKGDFDSAYEMLTRAEELAPDNAKVLINLANVLMGREDYAEAAEMFRSAEKISRGAVADMAPETRRLLRQACYGQALVHGRVGDWGKGLPHLRRAVAVDPSDTALRGRLATYLTRDGQFRAARQALDYGLELFPEDKELRRRLSWQLVDPDVPSEFHDPERALQLAEEDIAAKRANHQHVWSKAEALALMGRKQEALDAMDEAIRQVELVLADERFRGYWGQMTTRKKSLQRARTRIEAKSDGG